MMSALTTFGRVGMTAIERHPGGRPGALRGGRAGLLAEAREALRAAIPARAEAGRHGREGLGVQQRLDDDLAPGARLASTCGRTRRRSGTPRPSGPGSRWTVGWWWAMSWGCLWVLMACSSLLASAVVRRCSHGRRRTRSAVCRRTVPPRVSRRDTSAPPRAALIGMELGDCSKDFPTRSGGWSSARPRRRRYARGEVVFHEGDLGRHRALRRRGTGGRAPGHGGR